MRDFWLHKIDIGHFHRFKDNLAEHKMIVTYISTVVNIEPFTIDLIQDLAVKRQYKY